MPTAVHLLINNSEISVVPNLNKAYSSEGVPTLNVVYVVYNIYATYDQCINTVTYTDSCMVPGVLDGINK